MEDSSKRIEWTEILNLIQRLKPQDQELVVKGSKYCFRFVMVEESKRMGYLIVWKDNSVRSIYISRVEIPEFMPYICLDEHNEEIPSSLKFEEFDF